ncbi:MAG: phenylacetate--CoA ligase family protein [Thermodesulfobacteriota bacterium]
MPEYPEYWRKEIETMSRDKLKELQEKKFLKQLRYNLTNSLFYQEKFKQAGLELGDIKSLDDLAKIPFTSKDELRKSQEEVPPLGKHAACSMDKIIRIHSSSGTTGTPSYVGITRRDREMWTDIVARVHWSEGVRPNSRVIHGFGLSFFVGGLPIKDAIEEIGATFIPIGTGASDRLITTIKRVDADVLFCTPSYCLYLAEYARNRMKQDPRELGIKLICTGAEPGGGIPGVRKRMEEEWNCDVRESVGNADAAPTFFAECYYKTGNHEVAPDYVLTELIDPDSGEVLEWADDVEGEAVYTLIERECVPLLRFRTRDRFKVWTSACECGRTGYRVRCIGRTDDMLIVLGVNVFPSAIKDVVSNMRPNLTGDIQIVLDKPPPKVDPPLKVQVEYSSQVKDLDALKKKAEAVLRDKLVAPIQLELVPEGTLPRFEMKAKLIKKLYEE